MALQFDGTGSVAIPQWSEAGDFSISIPDATFNEGTGNGVILGRNISNANFISCLAGGVRVRINGNTHVYGSFSEGDPLNITVSRIGTTMTLNVNGVITTKEMSGSFVLDSFGRYFSDTGLYGGLVGGEVVMTGANNNTRTYDFEQPAISTTLPDTTDGQDGTLSGFTSGGFVGSNSINILTPSTTDLVKQRDVNGDAVFVVSGTYTAAVDPLAIEYTVDGAVWNTLEAAPSGGVFSGLVTVNGQMDVSVRFSDDILTEDTVENVTSALCFCVWWQSNAAGRGLNNQPVSAVGNNPKPMMFRNGDFSVAEDPVAYDANAAGSQWPYILQRYSDAGIPVCIGNVAVGGSAIIEWLKSTGTLYSRIQDFVTATGGIEYTLSVGGEMDSAIGTPEATMVTRLDQMISDLNTDFGTEHYLVYFPVGDGLSGTPSDIQAVRDSFTSVITNNALCHSGGDLSVIDINQATAIGNDGLHLKQDGDLDTGANIILFKIPFSNTLTINYNAPDGEYDIVLLDNALKILYSGKITVNSGSITLPMPAPLGTIVKGVTYDNNATSINGAWIQGVTV